MQLGDKLITEGPIENCLGELGSLIKYYYYYYYFIIIIIIIIIIMNATILGE